MIDTPNPSATPVKRLRKQLRPPARDLHPMLHEILNQLTVMNLSCFKFRAAAQKCCPPSLLVEIERMENAVIEMTSLLESVLKPLILESPQRSLESLTGNDRKGSSNVYPLFKPTKRRR